MKPRLNAILIYGLPALAGVLLLAGVAYWHWGEDAMAFMEDAVGQKTPPELFVLLYLLLPLIGFPISPFLVLIGVKFGTLWGVSLMLGGMMVHLLVAFLAANSLLRTAIQGVLRKKAYRLPEIPRKRVVWFSFVFMVVPGLSYSLKNYILALSGLRFRQFFLISLVAQGGMGVPFVIAGGVVAERSILLLAVVLLMLIISYVVALFIRRHFFKRPPGEQRTP